MADHLDARERSELCDLFDALGPDAPTLCEGWTTADLVAHLVVRERDPRSGPGIVVPKLAGYTAKLQDGAKARGYTHNVAVLRGGPPPVPWCVPGLRTLLNLNEWFVHHEDVRRANGFTPRTDRPDLDAAIWKTTQQFARLGARKLGDHGLVLVLPDGTRTVVRSRPANAELIGPPQEIALYLMGRRSAAQVTTGGPSDAVEALAKASFGI